MIFPSVGVHLLNACTVMTFGVARLGRKPVPPLWARPLCSLPDHSQHWCISRKTVQLTENI